MRIDAISQASQVYQSNKTKKYSQTGMSSFADKLEISQLGKDMTTAKTAVASASDVREDKVAAIKAAMANGTYEVSDDALADKLLESFDLPF